MPLLSHSSMAHDHGSPRGRDAQWTMRIAQHPSPHGHVFSIACTYRCGAHPHGIGRLHHQINGDDEMAHYLSPSLDAMFPVHPWTAPSPSVGFSCHVAAKWISSAIATCIQCTQSNRAWGIRARLHCSCVAAAIVSTFGNVVALGIP